MSTSIAQLPQQEAVRYLRPGESGYDQAVSAWNLLGSHRPAVVALATRTDHVVQAVRAARAEGLGVGVMATGHGTGVAVDGGMLINTSGMRGLFVDPTTATAQVEAGVTWAELNERAARHGLFGLQGSNSVVGVVGYSLGGGFGWLGRHYGFASQRIVSADVVTAAGEVITVDAESHPELFWGLRGSAGNLGIVTALQMRLVELSVVYGGVLYYPLPDATRVLTGYAEWTADQPVAMASSVALVNFPPMPMLPDEVRGRSFAAVRLCYSGAALAPGVAAVRELRRCLGEPLMDSVHRMPAVELDTISAEPRDPIPVVLHSDLVPALSPQVIAAATAAQTPDSGLLFVEFRQLGGALRVPDDELSPLNRTGAGFSVNAAGLAPTPEMHDRVRAGIAGLRSRLAPFVDGANYVNFLEGAGGAARMRTAFSDAEWQRLTDLKTRWDPTNLFRFNRNIPPRDDSSSPA